MPELFEAQAARTPDAVAVVCGQEKGDCRTASSEVRANRLARYLTGLGAGPERLVAVVMPRCAQMVTAVLAVLKAGAAYVPIDPGYPRRGGVVFMLADRRAGDGGDHDGSGTGSASRDTRWWCWMTRMQLAAVAGLDGGGLAAGELGQARWRCRARRT